MSTNQQLLSALRQTTQMLEIFRCEVAERINRGQMKNSPVLTAADINAAEALDDAKAAIENSAERLASPESDEKNT